jgi:hypothetical protein
MSWPLPRRVWRRAEGCLNALPKSLFGKIHPPVASRLAMRRIMATLMNVSLLCTLGFWGGQV